MNPQRDIRHPLTAGAGKSVTPSSYARSTMNAQDRAEVAEELEAIPRGTLTQNMYRAAYEQARYNGLGSRPQIAATPEAAHEVALSAVRVNHPDFVPERISPFVEAPYPQGDRR